MSDKEYEVVERDGKIIVREHVDHGSADYTPSPIGEALIGLVLGPLLILFVAVVAGTIANWGFVIVVGILGQILHKQMNWETINAVRPWVVFAVAIWAGIAVFRSFFPTMSDFAKYLGEVPTHLGNLLRGIFIIAAVIGGGFLLFHFLGAAFLK
jgi:hypothetical protein